VYLCSFLAKFLVFFTLYVNFAYEMQNNLNRKNTDFGHPKFDNQENNCNFAA